MSGFIEGEDRSQATLFPERLDDYIEENSAVRVIDVFIDELDISGLGFKTESSNTGRPAYHPTTLLKIYVYGYLNQVHSSRRLEREAQRNVELMWLTGRLAPDFKTIADFRKDNGEAIRLVCREFVMLCRKLNLFADAFVAIDGSKFKAVNNRDRNFTRAKMKRRLAEVDESIDRYLKQMASSDRQEPSEDKTQRLEDKEQLSLTDPDARSMKCRGSGIVGYNVQTAVDVRHHLIVAHEVTNNGSDRRQLTNMAKQAQSIIGSKETLKVVADRGYYRSHEFLDCDRANIITYVPRPDTSNNKARGQFGPDDFRYIEKDDQYECPGGRRLDFRTTMHSKGMTLHRYWAKDCQSCAIKSKCTTGKERRVSRWEHEEILESVQMRLTNDQSKMRERRATVEHPFGTLKYWMGATHFLTRSLDRVSTEMSLHILAYNLKRVIKIVGIKPLIKAIQV